MSKFRRVARAAAMSGRSISVPVLCRSWQKPHEGRIVSASGSAQMYICLADGLYETSTGMCEVARRFPGNRGAASQKPLQE